MKALLWVLTSVDLWGSPKADQRADRWVRKWADRRVAWLVAQKADQ